ncbi:MAG: NAD-dependent deacylase [Spirochaetales bacterium]|nr:NAD-dependent deacylase [Spirochaetales bacterium]MCF7937832.1 NAD-dependent deacylase [Spirochaetales bacterium]
MENTEIQNINNAAERIAGAKHLTAFTGAGISVESGIPPFRGEGGLWNTYDPEILELSYFYRNPRESWSAIKEIFYDFFTDSDPNRAHEVLAAWEQRGLLQTVITQNIDNLHFRAGSRNIVEYHGTSRTVSCTSCGKNYQANAELLANIPPACEECGGLLKPDFIFFGEGIPSQAVTGSAEAVNKTDVMILVGTTGEVFPAAMVPYDAKRSGAYIIEVNPNPSSFTEAITDLFIQEKAARAMDLLEQAL